MSSFQYVIKDEIGLHARPAGMLVKLVKGCSEKATVTKGGKTVDASKLMALMGLGIKQGDEITVTAKEEDLDKIRAFFEENL